MVISARYHLFKIIALILLAFATLWSFINPASILIWWLEALPVLIVWPIIAFTHKRRFPLSNLLFALIWMHSITLLIGAHYTYADVPAFNWLRDTFDLSRNHYDRVGHFAQGFVPAIAARELLLRTSPLKPGKWLFVLITLGCLGISAAYELIEWIAAVISETAAEDFLSMQGDVWDTQKDMALALLGAILAQVFLGKYHDNQLASLKPR